jgi:phage tail sheath gpL-like
MSSLVLTIKSTDTQANLQQKFKLDSNEKMKLKNDLAAYFKSAELLHQCDIDVQTGSANPVAASQTVTCATVNADETFVIGATTFTAKASPSGEEEFDQSGTDAQTATDLAAKISAHSTIGKLFIASADSGVVTVSARQKGAWANQIALSETGTGMTLGGSFMASGAGGADDAASSFDFGA